jgi:hypothetical protein
VSTESAKEIVRELLLDHRGSDDPITAREINEVIDEDRVGSFPGTRELIREIVIEDEIPVASTNQGYFVVDNEEELSEYVDNLTRRAMAILERRFAVLRAANTWHEDIATSNDEDLL